MKLKSGRPISSLPKSDFKTFSNTIFIIEKEAVFMKMIEEKYVEKYNCIIITGKGYPDMATRSLLFEISKNLKINMFLITDCDPYGLEIASIYKYGSISFGFQNEILSCPQIKWIGIKLKDLKNYENLLINFTEQDEKKLQSILLNDDEIEEEVKEMEKIKKKGEIEILTCSDEFEIFLKNFID